MTDDVKKLREITGAGVMECYQALREAAGDLDKAINIVHERGYAKAEKRRDRSTGAGLLYAYIHNERVGVLLDLRAETDFVTRSEPFKELAHNLAMQIAAMDPADIDDLLTEVYIKNESMKVQDVIKQVIAKTGENINVLRFCRYEI